MKIQFIFLCLLTFCSGSIWAGKGIDKLAKVSCNQLMLNAKAQQAEVSSLSGLSFHPLYKINLQSRVTALALSSNDAFFVAGTENGHAGIWRISGELIAPLTGHQGKITAAAIAPDRTWLVTCSGEGVCLIWDAKGKLLGTRPNIGQVIAIKISPDGNYIALGRSDGKVVLISLKDVSEKELSGISYDATFLDFSKDSRLLMAAGKTSLQPLILWDTQGTEIYRYLHPEGKGPYPPANWYTLAQFSNDGKTAMTSFYDGTIQYHDVERRKFKKDLFLKIDESTSFDSATASPDGKYLIGGLYDRGAIIYNRQSGKKISTEKTLPISGNLVKIYVAPDSSYFITIHMSRNFAIWDFAGNIIGLLMGYSDGAFPLNAQFSSDSQYLVMGGNDDAVTVWKLKDHSGWTEPRVPRRR